MWTSIVAAVLAVAGIILAYVFPEAEELSNMFWAFFDLSLFCLLIGYIPMFFAFMKLHKNGVQEKKGYWIKGGNLKRILFGIVPVIMLVVSLFFTLIPELNVDAILDNKVLIISSLVCIVIGEVLVFRASRKEAARKALRRANRK